jgi:hypothetical protein
VRASLEQRLVGLGELAIAVAAAVVVAGSEGLAGVRDYGLIALGSGLLMWALVWRRWLRAALSAAATRRLRLPVESRLRLAARVVFIWAALAVSAVALLSAGAGGALSGFLLGNGVATIALARKMTAWERAVGRGLVRRRTMRYRRGILDARAFGSEPITG